MKDCYNNQPASVVWHQKQTGDQEMNECGLLGPKF